MKIKFNSGNELPTITISYNCLQFPSLTVVVRAVFHKNNKYYPQVFFKEYLYKISNIKMESEDALKEIKIKNTIVIKNRTRYYFDDIIKVGDIYSVDILLDKKSYETYKNILVYNIPYETTGLKPLCIRFDKIN